MKLMKQASVLMAALALTASLATAQTETSQTGASDPGQSQSQQSGQPVYKDKGGVKTDYGQDRRQKAGTSQGYNTGATGRQVGKDQPAPVSGADQNAAASDTARYDRAARGTGVATGFVAAGIGLAILGLFVRRRSRHDYDEYDDDDEGPSGRPYGGGSGTNTRI